MSAKTKVTPSSDAHYISVKQRENRNSYLLFKYVNYNLPFCLLPSFDLPIENPTPLEK
jgi:hypothetical protein